MVVNIKSRKKVCSRSQDFMGHPEIPRIPKQVRGCPHHSGASADDNNKINMFLITKPSPDTVYYFGGVGVRWPCLWLFGQVRPVCGLPSLHVMCSHLNGVRSEINSPLLRPASQRSPFACLATPPVVSLPPCYSVASNSSKISKLLAEGPSGFNHYKGVQNVLIFVPQVSSPLPSSYPTLQKLTSCSFIAQAWTKSIAELNCDDQDQPPIL